MNAPDPGPGYRLLRDGEVIEATDSWFNRSTCQWNLGSAGTGHKFSASYWCPHRRKVEDEDRWIALSEFPNKFPCQVLMNDGDVFVAWESDGEQFHIPGAWVDKRYVTHWKPLKLSDPPEPQKSKEEAAFYEWCAAEKIHVSGLVTTARQGWLAALHWKEKNG